MKWLLVVAMLALPACSVLTKPGEIPVSSKLSPEAQVAQKTINEANILLNAVAQVIGQNLADGITTKEVAQAQLTAVKQYARDVDRAQALLDSGDVLGAKNKAELTAKLITALHKRVAEKARTK